MKRFTKIFEATQYEFDFNDPRREIPVRDPLLVKLELDSWGEFDPGEDWDDILDRDEIEEAYRKANVKFEEVQLGDEVYLHGDDWVIDEDGRRISDLADWIGGMWEGELYELTKNFMPEEDFWGDVGEGSECYHATPCENKEDILRDGINAENKTRGIENRSTGAAVFASWDAQEMGSYGDCVFRIKLGDMKKDGYMPDAGGEEPLEAVHMQEALAQKLGVEDFYPGESMSGGGIEEDTVVIHGSIPAKYIELAFEE